MLSEMEKLISDDGYAASFQSMGQYRTALLAALRAQADAQPVAHRFRQILDDGTPAAWNFCDGDYLHPSTSLDHSCWEVESLFIHPAPEAAQALSDEQVKAAQEVFEKWFCEDLGLDMDSDESERIITEMLKAAGAATVAEPVVDERAAFKVEGMTRAEFEAHLRACFQHDNVRAREQGRDAPISGLSADQEREIVERVELNYPTISHCPGCTAFDSDVAEVNFVQGCTGCTSRMQKIAGFGPLYRAAQSGQRAGVAEDVIEAAAKKLAEQFDYPWEHMPAKGKDDFRAKVRDISAMLAAVEVKK